MDLQSLSFTRVRRDLLITSCFTAVSIALAAPAGAQSVAAGGAQTQGAEPAIKSDSAKTPQTASGSGAPVLAPSDAPAQDESDIVITGQRQNLENALSIKRNAETILDSITAADVGSFPDKSVAEALQRVPGVTVGRFAGKSDTLCREGQPNRAIP